MRSAPQPLTVVLADRRPLWLDTLERTMWWLGAQVVGKTTSVAAGSAMVQDREPQLLIAGEDLEGEAGGYRLVSAARQAVPEIKVVVTSSRTDDAHAGRAFAAGGDAYLLTSGSRDDLAAAIRQLFKPTLFFAPPGASTALLHRGGTGGSLLTPRELEILGLAAQGHSNAELARRLWVTEQTVKFHLSNVYRKLGVANRTEASRWAQQRGLLDRAPLPQEAVA